MKRFMMKQDNDCHWYLVPVEHCKLFDEMMEIDWGEWTPAGEQLIESMRIDGPELLTFTDPQKIT